MISLTKKQFANKYSGGNKRYCCGQTSSDDILEFDPLTGQWKEVDKMMKTRSGHAVAVIDFDSGLCIV